MYPFFVFTNTLKAIPFFSNNMTEFGGFLCIKESLGNSLCVNNLKTPGFWSCEIDLQKMDVKSLDFCSPPNFSSLSSLPHLLLPFFLLHCQRVFAYTREREEDREGEGTLSGLGHVYFSML